MIRSPARRALPLGIVAILAAFIVPGLAGSASAAAAQSSSAATGTTEFGPCGGQQALSRPVAGGWTCWGPDGINPTRLRRSYLAGGTPSERREWATEVAANTSPGSRVAPNDVGYEGFHSHVGPDRYHWSYYANIYYGVGYTNGGLVTLGKIFQRTDVSISGYHINVIVNHVNRVKGYGSDIRARLRTRLYHSDTHHYFDDHSCGPTGPLAGTTLNCTHDHYYPTLSGAHFYVYSLTRWWNEAEANPSSPDGSWSVDEPLGPFSCYKSRNDKCHFD